MAFRLPTATDIGKRVDLDTTAQDTTSINTIIKGHSDYVVTFNLTDEQKHEFIVELTMLSIKYNGLRRESRSEIQVEANFNREIEQVYKRMKMLSRFYSRTGVKPSTTIPRLHWFTSYGSTSTFTESDFTSTTSGKTGQGNAITFNEFSANSYLAIATSEPLVSLTIGGNLNQIASFPLQGNITIDGQPFNLYVSDDKWLPVASTATFTVGV